MSARSERHLTLPIPGIKDQVIGQEPEVILDGREFYRGGNLEKRGGKVLDPFVVQRRPSVMIAMNSGEFHMA